MMCDNKDFIIAKTMTMIIRIAKYDIDIDTYCVSVCECVRLCLWTVRYIKKMIIISGTVEPLTNDHPHQRPSLSYDHISFDGQWFLFVYESLTSDQCRPSLLYDHTNVILRVVV